MSNKSGKKVRKGIAAQFLGSKLRDCRMKRGLSVVALARQIDPENEKSLSISIHGYEAGRNIPSSAMLWLLAKVLECKMEVFVEEVRDA